MLRNTMLTVLVTIMFVPALAQESGDAEEIVRQEQAAEHARIEREMERIEREEARREASLAREDERRDREERREEEVELRKEEVRSQQHEVEIRMQEAEQRLAEAARQVAELSMSRLPRSGRMDRYSRSDQRLVFGVTVGGKNDGRPVKGIEILGVSPGGAADDAGLRAGDVVTSLNGESLAAKNSTKSDAKLLDFMDGVEEGDVLDVEYLRKGKSQKTEVTPRSINNNAFAYDWEEKSFVVPDVSIARNIADIEKFVWTMRSDGFGDMELVRLTERLGSYFGTGDGLLVVRAPENEDLMLIDGDVILNIDGRMPTSVSHAMRILGSYEVGEVLTLEIMRDRQKRNIKLEIPDNRQSAIITTTPAAPLAEVAPVAMTVVIDRTHKPISSTRLSPRPEPVLSPRLAPMPSPEPRPVPTF